MKSTSFIVPALAAAFLVGCGENGKEKAEIDQQAAENDSIQETVSVTIPEEQLTTAEYEYEMVVPDLQMAWGFDFLQDSSMLIAEKTGELIRFKDGKKQQVQGAPQVYNRGQGGFLDVAVGPNYESDGWIYFTYASEEGDGEGGNTALMRAKLENNSLTNKEVLYKATPNTTRGFHFGSRIEFDNNGHLYFSIGDRGDRDVNPQDLTRDGGKVYRLNLDGSIPQDNPFVGQAGATEATFSYGHRNPQGMIYNPQTNEIWVHEHGPQGGDEINVIQKGANYGWPVVSYGINYDGTSFTDETSGPDFKDPIFYWEHSIAPSGFVYVTSDKYPELKGNLLAGSLKFQYVEHLRLDGKKITGREKILEQVGRVRDIVQSPAGDIYVSAEGKGIVKIIPKQ